MQVNAVDQHHCLSIKETSVFFLRVTILCFITLLMNQHAHAQQQKPWEKKPNIGVKKPEETYEVKSLPAVLPTDESFKEDRQVFRVLRKNQDYTSNSHLDNDNLFVPKTKLKSESTKASPINYQFAPLLPAPTVEEQALRVDRLPPKTNDFKSPTFHQTVDRRNSLRAHEREPMDWWNDAVTEPLNANNSIETATANDLLHMSLFSSPRIQAISQDPLIREAQVIEADAEFDPVLFTRNLFEDRTDPVGNTLTTGGADFLEDHIFTSNTGLRKKLRKGAEVDISQQLGFQNSNSQFFVPQDQGTATLAINVSQPILRGAGLYYNRLQILIAQSAGEVAWEVFSSELQDELQRVLSSYWQLYFDRSNFLQVQRNVQRGQRILDTLEQRAGLDSLPSQIARARSAVEARKTDLANALRDIRNAETNIRRLVGDDNWLAKQKVEILPIERPAVSQFDVPMQKVVRTALENRPEIREAAQRTKIAAFQRDVSTNELLPSLSLLMGTYVSGLEGGSGIERALVEQFSNTTPGYSLGLEFEVPYRNRAAISRQSQSRLQLRKLQHELKENVQLVIAESQIAYRRVQSAIKTLEAARVSIQAARQDLAQQEQRFQTFALIEGDLVDGQSPTTILDQLLDAQERLTAAERTFAQSVLEFQVSTIALNRATGTLLIHRKVSFERTNDGEQPGIRLYQTSTSNLEAPSSIVPGRVE